MGNAKWNLILYRSIGYICFWHFWKFQEVCYIFISTLLNRNTHTHKSSFAVPHLYDNLFLTKELRKILFQKCIASSCILFWVLIFTEHWTQKEGLHLYSKNLWENFALPPKLPFLCPGCLFLAEPIHVTQDFREVTRLTIMVLYLIVWFIKKSHFILWGYLWFIL